MARERFRHRLRASAADVHDWSELYVLNDGIERAVGGPSRALGTLPGTPFLLSQYGVRVRRVRTNTAGKVWPFSRLEGAVSPPVPVNSLLRGFWS